MHNKNRLWSCLNDLQMFNVGNGGCVGVIESNHHPFAWYIYDCGGIKSAPQDPCAFAHRVVPHKIIADNTRARITALAWSHIV